MAEDKIIKRPCMHWKYGYAKEVEGGKEIIRLLDGFGRPSREVDVYDWDLDSYINYCLYPIHNCIKRMGETDEDEGAISEYADILGRLYDAARVQLKKMDGAIYKDMGYIKIRTTNEQCYGGFLQQDFLEVYVKPEPVEAKGG